MGVSQRGLVPIDYDAIQPAGSIAYTPAHKRKLDVTGFEIPDSEDEDYGWQEDDDSALPRPPPQWQGSEDILLGQHPETDENEIQADSEPDQETERPVDEG